MAPNKAGPEAVQASKTLTQEVSVDGASVREPTLRELEESVKKAELTERLLRLRNVQGRQPRIPDMAEQSGLGPMTDEMRQSVQSRAFSAPERREENLLMSLIKNPGALSTVIETLRSVLVPPQGQNTSGDGVLGLLSSMGYSIKELIESKNQSTMPSKFSLGGVDVSGMQMSPEIFSVLLKREDLLNTEKASTDRWNMMATTLGGIYTDIKESGVLDGLASRFSDGGQNGRVIRNTAASVAEAEDDEETKHGQVPELTELLCPNCGNTTSYNPTQVKLGQTVDCNTSYCDYFWVIMTEKEAQEVEKAEVKTAEKQEQEAVSISCPGCSQAISVGELPIGTKVVCPVCDEKFKIISENEPVPPVVEN